MAQWQAWWRGHRRLEHHLHKMRDVTCHEEARRAAVGTPVLLAARHTHLLRHFCSATSAPSAIHYGNTVATPFAAWAHPSRTRSPPVAVFGQPLGLLR